MPGHIEVEMISQTVSKTARQLGTTQLSWPKEALVNSNATRKIVSSDIPFSNPTGANLLKFGRDMVLYI